MEKAKKNTIIIANEWLTATKHSPQSHANAYGWSAYNFTEDRLTTYLRHTYSGIPLIMDIGFMHQFVKVPKGFNYVLYLSIDILYQNHFTSAKKVMLHLNNIDCAVETLQTIPPGIFD